jgi:hypothetical protein
MDNAMEAQQPVHFATIFCGNPGQQQVLLYGKPHVRLQVLDQLPQSGANLLLPEIPNASANHPHTAKPAAISLRMPPKIIFGAMPHQWTRRRQRISHASLQLVAEC